MVHRRCRGVNKLALTPRALSRVASAIRSSEKLIIVEQVVYFCQINRITKAHPSLTLMQIKHVLMKFLTAPKGRK